MASVARRLVTVWLVLCALAFPFSQAASAETAPVNTGYFNGLALHGYDVMTYWQGGNPQPGNPEIKAQYKSVDWVFVSEANRQAFLVSPEKFAPQYGGYCAYAASQNAIADVDPLAWRIWNDKLYLNYDLRVRRTWANDIDGNIAKADAFWPALIGAE